MGLTDVFQAIQKSLSSTKSAEISGIKFEIGLLSFEEETKTDSFPQEDIEPLMYYNKMRIQTLSYAIKNINGEPVPAIVDVKNGDIVEKKQGSLFVKEFISTLPVKIVEQLFDIYIDLKEESEAALEKEIKYNWFKTPEQREEEAKKKKEEPPEKKEETEKSEVEQDIKLTEVHESPEEDKPSV
jgi:NACalpha-BTF3-like transcription factor